MDAWVDSFAKGVTWHNGKAWILKLPSCFLGQILKIKAPAKDVLSQVRRTQNLLDRHGPSECKSSQLLFS